MNGAKVSRADRGRATAGKPASGSLCSVEGAHAMYDYTLGLALVILHLVKLSWRGAPRFAG